MFGFWGFGKTFCGLRLDGSRLSCLVFLGNGKLTMLGLEASVDKPREKLRSCREAKRRVVNILNKFDVWRLRRQQGARFASRCCHG